MASDDVNHFFFTKTAEVETRHSAALDFLVSEDANFLLLMVEKTHGAIRAADSDQVLKCCYRVGHTFSNLDITMVTLCNFLERFLGHELTLERWVVRALF